MKELYTEIEIEAPAERIWEIVTDFARFPQWNPFIRRIGGSLRPGEQLEVHFQSPDSRGMTFRPKVLTVEPNKELSWIGHLIIPGLFDGEHHLAVQPIGEGRARFVQREVFTGVLVPLLWKGMLNRDTRRGFEQMNQALKKRAEQEASVASSE